jgi:hypothetical protein
MPLSAAPPDPGTPNRSLRPTSDSTEAFTVGYRIGSTAFGAATCAVLVVAWPAPFALARRIGAGGSRWEWTVVLALVLVTGILLRLVHRPGGAGARRVGAAVALGLGQGMLREAELATGLVASLAAGVVLAEVPVVRDAIGGWVETATGFTSIASVVTLVLVTAAGTLTTELARRRIVAAMGRP